jgi:menaquinone-dependent protoporphyrinogen oxidase
MKILEVYGSDYGQAQAVLARVTAALEARGHAISIFKGDAIPSGVTVDGFDATVIAASVHMEHYQAYIRDFVQRHSSALQDRPSAFVSVSGTRSESLPEWRAEAEGYAQ